MSRVKKQAAKKRAVVGEGVEVFNQAKTFEELGIIHRMVRCSSFSALSTALKYQGLSRCRQTPLCVERVSIVVHCRELLYVHFYIYGYIVLCTTDRNR